MKKNIFTKLFALALALVLTLSLTACGGSSAGDNGTIKIGVPNDTTNEARALLLLQQEGLITLADGAGVTATTKDIVENPKNLEIVELEAAQVSHSLQDVDFGIINGNYALEAGLSVADALAVESAEGVAAEQYGNIIAVADGNQDSEKIKALVAACQSDEVAKYIEDTYNGAVVPLTLS